MIDNYAIWEGFEAEKERDLERYPRCGLCLERITDEELFDINGFIYCCDCAAVEFKRCTSGYVRK